LPQHGRCPSPTVLADMTAGASFPNIPAGTRRGRFQYRPHLFPGMDLKLRLAHKLQFHMLPREAPSESAAQLLLPEIRRLRAASRS
jgi:hypothetical protein